MTDSVVIYGPPGTGKTSRLMGIMKELRDERGVPTPEIGFMGFTKAAAEEALRRLSLSRRSKTIRTIHSYAFEAAKAEKTMVVDRSKLAEFASLVGMEITGSDEEQGRGDEYLELVNFSIAKKIDLWDGIEAMAGSHRNYDLATAKHFQATYEQWKDTRGYMDFNDMLIHAVRRPLDLGIKYLFVDEAQDLSPLQWDVIDSIAEKCRCIWLAGDDDQAIYTWAGADPHGMRSRDRGRHRVLEQSFRVPRNIHDIAQRISSRIMDRVQKVYAPVDAPGAVRNFGDFLHVPSPLAGEEVLVLYRNHANRFAAESWLTDRGVPYTTGSGRPSWFQDRYANAVRSFLHWEAGQEPSENAKRALAGLGCHSKPTMPWWASLSIPQAHVNYLRKVDVFQAPTVRMSTIHAAKGGEADRVVLVNGMGEKTFSNSEHDDEHRVWYVAVTRTRGTLDVVMANNPYPLGA